MNGDACVGSKEVLKLFFCLSEVLKSDQNADGSSETIKREQVLRVTLTGVVVIGNTEWVAVIGD